MAALCDDIYVLVGFADSREGHAYNAAALLHENRILNVYHKIELPNYGVFDEKRYFCPGSTCMIFVARGCRVSVSICEDIWIPGSPTEFCAIQNERAGRAESICVSVPCRQVLVPPGLHHQPLCRGYRATVFYNNLVGGQDELVFDGGSMVVDADRSIGGFREAF